MRRKIILLSIVLIAVSSAGCIMSDDTKSQDLSVTESEYHIDEVLVGHISHINISLNFNKNITVKNITSTNIYGGETIFDYMQKSNSSVDIRYGILDNSFSYQSKTNYVFAPLGKITIDTKEEGQIEFNPANENIHVDKNKTLGGGVTFDNLYGGSELVSDNGFFFISNLNISKYTINEYQRNYTVFTSYNRTEMEEDVSQRINKTIETFEETFNTDAQEEITLFVTPEKNGETKGLTMVGRNTTVLTDVGEVVGNSPTLFHELVHTSQSYSWASDMRWSVEAYADYFGGKTTAKLTETDNSTIKENIIQGEDVRYLPQDNVTVKLTDPSSWSVQYQYHRGSDILYLIDMRLQQNDNYDLVDTISWLNSKEDSVSLEDYLHHIKEHTSEEFISTIEEYIRTNKELNITKFESKYTANIFDG